MRLERLIWGLIVRTIALLLALGLAIWMLAHVMDLVLLVLLATIFATGLARISYIIDHIPLPPNGWTLPPVLTVLMVYTIVIGTLVFGSWQLAAPAFQQIDTIVARLPIYVDNLDNQIELLTGQENLISSALGSGAQVSTIQAQIQANAGRLVGFASSAFGVFTSAVFTLVIALYMTIDGERIRDGLLDYLPPSQRTRWRAITIDAGKRVAGWLIGQAFLSLTIGVVTWIGLLVLGVPYALGLAVVAGVLEVLPILGPIIAGVLGVTVAAATGDLGLAGRVLIFYVAVQQLENNLLVPRIIGEASGLHPLAVMLVLLIGSSLFGLIGAFLAVPVATVLHVVIERLRHEQAAEPAARMIEAATVAPEGPPPRASPGPAEASLARTPAPEPPGSPVAPGADR